MNTTVLEKPAVARQSAPLHSAPEGLLGIPWYMTIEEVHAELDQAEREFDAGLGITHAEFLEEVKKW